MTQEEFTRFTKTLFTHYPSLHGWLKHNSPDAAATLQHWHRQLADYTYQECLDVLSGWENTTTDPFGYNSRDTAALIIRSVIDKGRDKKRQRRETEQRRAEYAARRGGTFADGLQEHFDSNMLEALKTLQPVHLRMLHGEISESDYERQKCEVFQRLGIGDHHGSHTRKAS